MTDQIRIKITKMLAAARSWAATGTEADTNQANAAVARAEALISKHGLARSDFQFPGDPEKPSASRSHDPFPGDPGMWGSTMSADEIMEILRRATEDMMRETAARAMREEMRRRAERERDEARRRAANNGRMIDVAFLRECFPDAKIERSGRRPVYRLTIGDLIFEISDAELLEIDGDREVLFQRFKSAEDFATGRPGRDEGRKARPRQLDIAHMMRSYFPGAHIRRSDVDFCWMIEWHDWTYRITDRQIAEARGREDQLFASIRAAREAHEERLKAKARRDAYDRYSFRADRGTIFRGEPVYMDDLYSDPRQTPHMNCRCTVEPMTGAEADLNQGARRAAVEGGFMNFQDELRRKLAEEMTVAPEFIVPKRRR